MINSYISHARDFAYMSGAERDRLRVQQTAEVFTPTHLVKDMLDKLDPHLFKDKTKTFIDNSCGDGQFLVEVVIRKMENGHSLIEALKTTYGVELMQDNVDTCRMRLAGPNPTKEILKIVEQNIVCHDSLTYDYSFRTKEQIEAHKLF